METCDFSSGIASIQSWLSCSSNVRDLFLIPIAAFGAYLLWSRTRAVNRQAAAATKQALTAENARDDAGMERRASEIDKAIEQLEKTELGTRIHAIYKLQRISETDEYFHWIIMEILTAFLRERWPYLVEGQEASTEKTNDVFPADKKAALLVLGNRPDGERAKDVNCDRYLDLRHIDLANSGMDERVLDRADLANTNLRNSHLERSSFVGSYFVGSLLDDAKLIDADLTDAHFENSSCIGVDFSGSNVLNASFDGAIIDRATFTNVNNLTEAQLQKAKSASGVVLPEHFSVETHRPNRPA